MIPGTQIIWDTLICRVESIREAYEVHTETCKTLRTAHVAPGEGGGYAPQVV